MSKVFECHFFTAAIVTVAITVVDIIAINIIILAVAVVVGAVACTLTAVIVDGDSTDFFFRRFIMHFFARFCAILKRTQYSTVHAMSGVRQSLRSVCE